MAKTIPQNIQIEKMMKFEKILKLDFNITFSIFHHNVLSKNRYFSNEMVFAAEKYLKENIFIID